MIVATADGVSADGCHIVEDFGEVNIHRWWNTGIDYAQARGATHVLVMNDDVNIDHDAIPRLLAAMVETGAAIASPGDGGLFIGRDPYWRVLNGACWLLDLSKGLRPDERFRWWYGDNDLDMRARTEHGGVVSIRVHFTHLHANELTAASPELQAIAEADHKVWEAACG